MHLPVTLINDGGHHFLGKSSFLKTNRASSYLPSKPWEIVTMKILQKHLQHCWVNSKQKNLMDPNAFKSDLCKLSTGEVLFFFCFIAGTINVINNYRVIHCWKIACISRSKSDHSWLSSNFERDECIWFYTNFWSNITVYIDLGVFQEE